VGLSKRLYRWIEAGNQRLLTSLHPHVYPGRGIKMPPIFLVTLPKAGSVYIQRALRQSLQIPWASIRQGGIVDITFDWNSLKAFSRGNVLTRVHLPPRPYLAAVLPEMGIDKIVLHLRDPRTQIISWTRHVDRNIETRGIGGAILDCQLELPKAYEAWSFEARLEWQIENQLPRFIKWTADWMQIAAATPGLDVLMTTYEGFASSPVQYIETICGFYRIPLQRSWLRLPEDAVGKNNIFHKETRSAAAIMGARLHAVATEALPATMRERFGWPDE
jgi:hypothetical protein